jgi:hypothetical protein
MSGATFGNFRHIGSLAEERAGTSPLRHSGARVKRAKAESRGNKFPHHFEIFGSVRVADRPE